MKPLTIALPLLLLCSCGEPRVLNPGASLSVTAVSDHDMSIAAWEHSTMGQIVTGLYIHGEPGSILLLDCGDASWTLPHEVAHRMDASGKTYAQCIEEITPQNPTPEMARKLAACWEIEAQHGDPWLAIYERWGAGAVGHKDILARIGH
jgi:hypothetical protein